MAQRATKFAKKASRHVEIGALARAGGDASDDLRAVPLDILPMLAPFRKRGRLSLRIEKLPIQARLSAGRNNGDRSYSLALDELEDLSYLAPEGTDPRPILSLRIMALDDGDAATIALRDLPVEFGGNEYGDGVDAEDVRRLIDELTRVKSTLALRESELVEARLKADARLAEVQAEKKEMAARPDLEKERERWQRESAATLAKAHSDWQESEAARFAAAEAKWRERADHAVEKERASSKAMRERGDAIELRRLRDELMAMQSLLAERETELAQLKAVKPQPPAREDAQGAIARAEKEWKAGEATRIAAAEGRLLEKTDRALGDARAEAKIAQQKAEAELRRLRDQLSTLQATLADREKDLAQARSATKGAEERGRKDADTALAQAEQSWKAREAERLAAAEAQWQQQSVRALGEARAQGKAEQEAALARGAAQIDAALAKAESDWKAREAERFAAAQEQWREQSAKAVAEARAQVQATRDESNVELARARAELANAQSKLVERDTALADARAAVERVREEAKANLSNAEKSWKAAEAARAASVEKRLREQSGSALGEAEIARAEAETELRTLRERTAVLETNLSDRELELTQAIARINATETEIESLRENEDLQVRRVRGEVTALETALAERDEELAQARLFTERSYERWQKQAESDLAKAQKAWKSGEASRLADARAQWQEESRKSLVDCLAAERRAGKLPDVHMPEEAVVGSDIADSDIAGSGDARPMPNFAPPPPDAPHVPVKPHLAKARDAADQALDRLAMDAYQLLANPTMPDITHPADTKIIKGGFVERRRNEEENKSLFGSAAIAAAFAAVAAAIFFVAWPMISASLRPAAQQQVVAAPPPAPVVKQAETPKATVLRSMNVRSGPSTSNAVITTLKAGTQIAIAERHGNWVRVTLDAGGGKSAQRGWVFGASLKFPDAAGQPMPENKAAAVPVTPVRTAPPAAEPARETEHAPDPAPDSAPESQHPAETPPAAPAANAEPAAAQAAASPEVTPGE